MTREEAIKRIKEIQTGHGSILLLNLVIFTVIGILMFWMHRTLENRKVERYTTPLPENVISRTYYDEDYWKALVTINHDGHLFVKDTETGRYSHPSLVHHPECHCFR